MKSYTQTQNQHDEVFDKASIEPVLITKQEKPSYVILSAEKYKQLITKLEELEDINWGKTAEDALDKSVMVGSKEFTETLEKLANG